MKATFKYISLLTLGIAAIALLTSVRPMPASTAPVSTTLTLKTATVSSTILLAKDDGQESNGGKKTKGG